MKFEKGKDYSYQKISDFAAEFSWSLKDHGPEMVGEQFLVIQHPYHDLTVSFVLTGHGYGSIFTCCYSDHE